MTDVTFADFGLADPLLRALERAGFDRPTPIQHKSIPAQMQGRDILGIAQTGTGKTAAFGLPILHHILQMEGKPDRGSCRALILCPTRELAVQIRDNLKAMSDGARLSTVLVLGGMPAGAQIKGLSRGVDVVIATPGRLVDLASKGHLDLAATRFVVLDEADRMLDMGFVHDVRKIVRQLHPKRQSALFSATMPENVQGLVDEFLHNPVTVEVARQATVVKTIDQRFEQHEGPAKRARVREILDQPDVIRAILFARTKRGADRIGKQLSSDDYKVDVIHGDKTQSSRQKALGNLRAGRVQVLVATDIVARGIDVPGITHVINYDVPDDPENYVHRIGRTGRNGAEGVSITLYSPEEVDKMRAVEKETGLHMLPEGLRARPNAPRPQRRRVSRSGGAVKAKGAGNPQGEAGKPGAKPKAKPAGRKGGAFGGGKPSAGKPSGGNAAHGKPGGKPARSRNPASKGRNATGGEARPTRKRG